MAKYTNRLKARLAYARLCESAKEGKNWIVTRKLILETEEGDLELNKGEQIEIGADPEGNMAVNGSAACVIISDPELAAKIADTVVNADEMSDVNFVTKDAIDAVMDGEEADQVIDDLAADVENEGEEEVVSSEEELEVEVPELNLDQKESVEAKFAKFSENRINPKRALVCESILVDEEDNSPINMYVIKQDKVKKESFGAYADFVKRVSELKGSLQPGKKEIALTESGEVMGEFDTEAGMGELYPENSFETVEEMEDFNSEPENLMTDGELFGAEEFEGAPVEEEFENEEELMVGEEDVFESCLKKYEESTKSGKDYVEIVNNLKKAGLKESAIAKVVATFDNRRLNECVRIWDHDLGKNVLALKESVSADQFISDAEEAGARKGRFSKRFFG